MGKLFPNSPVGNNPFLSGQKEKEVVFIQAKDRTNNGSSKENLVSPGSAPVRFIGFNRESSVGSNDPPLRRTSVTRQSSVPDSSPQSDTNAGDGPFNFRQRLRKTEFAPTDTLKKMKELRSSQSIDE